MKEFSELVAQLEVTLTQYYLSKSPEGEKAAEAQLIKACAKVAPNGEVRELSDTQKVILTLVSGGAGNKEIAEKLELSERTIKNYLSIIYDLLKVNNRTEAAIAAMRRGLIEVE